jgi:hypothetical protein
MLQASANCWHKVFTVQPIEEQFSTSQLIGGKIVHDMQMVQFHLILVKEI